MHNQPTFVWNPVVKANLQYWTVLQRQGMFQGTFHWGALVTPRQPLDSILLHGLHSLLHLPLECIRGWITVRTLQYTRKASRATARPFHSIPVSFIRGSHIFPPLATPSPFHQRYYTTLTSRAPRRDGSILTTIQWPTNSPVASTTLIPSTPMMARSSRTRRRVVALRVSAPRNVALHTNKPCANMGEDDAC
jgi:hypothetical protein